MNSLPTIATVEAGMTLPEREHVATNVSLFMYNAAVWNHHRIHYDEAYTTGVEGHAGVVIDGPLQGDWLSQVPLNWLAQAGELVSFSYSNRRAAHLGERLLSGGTVVSVDASTGLVELDLFIKNESGDVITPGNATVRLSA